MSRRTVRVGTGSLVVLLCSWASVGSPAASERSADREQTYTTHLEKTLSELEPLEVSSFSIPAGQCSGFIDQSLLCGARRARSVRVSVRDTAFVALRLHDSLRNATVLRARCRTDARVVLAVHCDPEPLVEPRVEPLVDPLAEPGRRRRAARLLPASHG